MKNKCSLCARRRWGAIVATTGLWFLLLVSQSQALAWPVHRAAVASAHPLATQAGLEIMNQGGNAFDAAVAVSATLAVVQPAGSGLGGGGFWLLHRASDGRDIMLDGRERAPLAATRDMFLDSAGKPLSDRSVNGPLAAGIPGLPAALAHLAENFGCLPLTVTLAPAIRHAEHGFAVGERHVRALLPRAEVLRRYPATAAIFFHQGRDPAAGDLLIQKDLAKTLRSLATLGRAGFYSGRAAARLVEGVHAAGGLWTLRDLVQYQAVERNPVRGTYRGIRITSAAPPSAGGIGLIEMLNILSAYDLGNLPGATRKHVIVEAMRRAYRDRTASLGDPDFVGLPVQQLLSPNYAAGLRTTLRLDRALPSERLAPPTAAPAGAGEHTTHFSVLDPEGNAVAATLTINNAFGSGFMVPGTGVLLNDEMDDFTTQPGSPNIYGLIGGEANTIAPGKRMLSSMTPTFLDDGRRLGLIGTPGGSRIVSMVLLATLEFADGKGPAAWVATPRFHHQYLPDVIEYEPGALAEYEVSDLITLGHALKKTDSPYGDMQAILWDRQAGRVEAVSDPRGEGSGWVQ